MVPWAEVEGDAILARRYADGSKRGACWALGEVADIASGLYVSEYVPEDTGGAKPYLRVDNVRAFLPNLTGPDLVHVRADLVPGYARVSVRVSDVVIARTATLGRAFVVDASLDGAVMSQHVTRLRVRDDLSPPIGPHVLAAYLNTPEGKEAVLSRASGSTRLELTHHDLATVEIPKALASVAVDGTLAARLATLFKDMRTRVSSARTLCGTLVGEAPAQERGFRASMTAFDEAAFEESMLPRFHAPAWAEVAKRLSARFRLLRLGDIAAVQRGAGTSSKEYRDSGIPYLRTSSLVNEGVDLFPDHYGDEATYDEHGQGVAAGDILLTIEGKIGFVALLGGEERALIKNHVEVIRPFPSAPPPGFITAWLGAWPAQLQLARFTVVQTTIPGIASASREILLPVEGKTAADRKLLQDVMTAAADGLKDAVAARVELRRELDALRARVCAATGQSTPEVSDVNPRPDRGADIGRQTGLVKGRRQAPIEEELY